jgi:hypothetical protein
MQNNEIPSMDNIYNSEYYPKVRQYEQNLSDDYYKKAQMPFNTGVIPHYISSDDMNVNVNGGNGNGNVIRSLSGEDININDFTHGNMKPFLKKGITQNTEQFGLNKNLGYSSDINIKKHEVKKNDFFNPVVNFNNPIDNAKFLKDRVNLTTIQNNISPIQQVRVGPGLNLGYTADGSGGFQQADTLKFVLPKSKEELRPGSDQRTSIYTLPMKPKNNIQKRGIIAPLNKNRTATTFEYSPDNWFKGQSVLKKDTERPIENVKDTSKRIDSHIDYYGSLKYQEEFISKNDDYGRNTIIIYDNERNLTQKETPVANFSSVIKAMVAPITDAIKITMKEYLIDAPRLYGNATPQLPEKATLYDPITHIMKTTIKETTIHEGNNGTLTGNDGTYSALYDTAKTTVKETTIHEGNNGTLTGNDGTYSALYDTAKTTTKETTIHEGNNGTLTGNDGTYSSLYDNAKTTTKETTIHEGNNGTLTGNDGTYSSLYDTAKTTTKETTIHEGNNGNLTGNDGTYSSLYDTAKTTTKETTIHEGNNGTLTGNDGTYSSLYDTAKTTTKETTIHEGNNGNLTGNDGTYSSLYDTAKTTTKETTIHEGNNGNLSGYDESYSALYDIAKTTVKETTIHEGNGGYIEGKQKGYVNNNNKMRTTLRQTLPKEDTTRNINNTRYYSTYVYDPSIVAKTTVKETTVDAGTSKYGFLGGFLNSLFGGYLIKEENAKNTQRQFSIVDNYGIAAGGVSTFVPRDREAENNAEIDGTREMLLIKAGHTPNGAGKFVGVPKEEINMVVNKKQIDLEESARIGNMGLAYEGLPVRIENENLTKQKFMNNAYNNRLDSSILSTLVDNDDIIKINPIRSDCDPI